MLKQLLGSFGATAAGACCLGFAPFLAGLSAVGAGFLINDAILIPLLLLALGFTIWNLARSHRAHGHIGPLYLGAITAVIAFAALWFFPPLAYAALVALVGASVWDIVTIRKLGAASGAPRTP